MGLAAGRVASCRDGCTEAIMLAHGFSIDMMVELVNAGLATATGERVVAGGSTIEVARVKITEAGRRALAGPRK
jgi:membrane carboxypeptidase/penicillin-binding protein PbpC